MAKQIDSLWLSTAILQFFLCSIGLIFNGFLAYTIARNKKLRHTCCGIFILFLAIFDCIAEFFLVTLSTFLTLTGITIPLLTCFWIDFICPFAQNNAQILMFSISIDRLMSILFPLKYKNFSTGHKWEYVGAVIFGPLIYGAYLVWIFYKYAVANADKPDLCMPSDYFGPEGTFLTFLVLFCVNVGICLVYILIWILLKFKLVKIQEGGAVEKGVNKSLMVIMWVTFFCLLPVPLLVNFVVPSSSMDPVTFNLIVRCLLQLNKAAQAVNAPILYVCSAQYRHAMRKEFRRIFEKESNFTGTF